MKGNPSFWDSSALVPLFCRDPYSARSRQWLRRFSGMTVWWGTVVEIHGAFVRLVKDEQLLPQGAGNALLHLNQFRQRWREVLPVERVRDLAEDCLERYRIRSADALQLAAALLWCKELPKGRPFVCFDSVLSEAARQSGFEIYS